MSNEEQMRKEFEAWWLGGERQNTEELYAPSDIAYASWQAATASKQREIATLNQQVLELSAQGEVMREALRIIRAMPSPVDPRNTGDRPIFDQWANTTRIAREAISTAPSAALLAHDNEVAAKALEEFKDKIETANARRVVYLPDVIDMLDVEIAERRNRK